jgi:hypothetical protein|tara:strand:- start:465 stop:821 length:357 start_codon:yes stop_codon:yes gene_type:complete
MSQDIISRILAKGESLDSELATFLEEGVSSILMERKDPYFTIAKNKVKAIMSLDSPMGSDTSYQVKMLPALNTLYFNINDGESFNKVFVEMCLEVVRENRLLNKSSLIFLNEIHKLNS